MYDFLLSDEARALRSEVRDFVKTIPRQLLLDMDADKVQFPKEFLAEAGKRNLMGCRYPREWGGRGLDWVSTVMVMEEIGTLGYIMACTFGVGAELVCDAIIRHGTDRQKEKYVRPLLKGEIFAAECLTEPRGGSDFFATNTTAEDKGDHYVINGQKRFIVGGEGADYFLVYAKTDPEAKAHKSLTCFIVDRSEGVMVDYIYGLMGCRGGGAARIIFKDAKVPKENIVGSLHGGYAVFNTMMIPERLGTAAMTIGAARPALEVATGYTTRRKAFGREIARYQGVSFQVAEAAMLLDACRSMAYTTSRAVDTGVSENEIRRLVSESKKFITESCQKVVHNSMQVMGGIGYTNVFPVERIFRDVRLASIWTGTNEVMSLIIASEWYRKYMEDRALGITRDCENDAAEAFAEGEKIYE
ncbi:acyl-CoA/acyl-ACP dehydrogenase [Desulfobotulus sp. H1]|uniref:Acyl-CoA/acyl-ACP dehydrogenase n=1 Tax=Desulfobotulus pelophilus TaxID=2823377 RepID=A0ABT3N7S4_9BACT|nr:acyl-CoA dehydrogenase family protein [Desulfobotulus pelophilus]MCW7753503.1 acyl-CoA/acyl-ACP dehydrogenase [Desulfobotulus pelophilus]